MRHRRLAAVLICAPLCGGTAWAYDSACSYGKTTEQCKDMNDDMKQFAQDLETDLDKRGQTLDTESDDLDETNYDDSTYDSGTTSSFGSGY